MQNASKVKPLKLVAVKLLCLSPGFMLAYASLGVLAAAPAIAQGLGGFSLKPGKTREIHIDSADHVIRLCNGEESAGALEVRIDNHAAHDLAPGVCPEDTGSDIHVYNASNGTVNGVYSRVYYLND